MTCDPGANEATSSLPPMSRCSGDEGGSRADPLVRRVHENPPVAGRQVAQRVAHVRPGHGEDHEVRGTRIVDSPRRRVWAECFDNGAESVGTAAVTEDDVETGLHHVTGHGLRERSRSDHPELHGSSVTDLHDSRRPENVPQVL